VVGFTAGGASDVVARIYAEKLQARLGQPFVVENKPGASSLLANEYVARRPADGLTLLFNAQPMVVAPLITPSTHKYNALRDFTPIAHVTDILSVVTVGAGSKFATFSDLIDFARKNPGMVSVGTSGLGSSDHLSLARLEKMAGVRFNIAHFKGEADAAVAVASNTIDFRMAAYVSAKPLLQSGKIKVLAVTSEAPSPVLPGVPSISESVPGFSHVPFQGFWGPPGMDAQLVARINREFNAINAMPDVQKRLADLGFQTTQSSPAEFAAFLKKQMDYAAEAVKAAAIQPQ
jgi:tripartite-type tricarboxylate transporter receptor subunit TctC